MAVGTAFVPLSQYWMKIYCDVDGGCNGRRIVAARGVAETTGDTARGSKKKRGCTIRLFGTNNL
jgi:hypothetical protein